MNSRNMTGMIGWAAVFLLLSAIVISFLFTKTELVNGQVVDAGYASDSDSVSTFKVGDAPPQDAVSIEHFYLVLEVKGKPYSYTVEYDTYRKAMTGQASFRMWCTPLSCSLIEK